MVSEDEPHDGPSPLEAMRAASRELPDEPGAHIFLEDRVEWSVSAAPGGRVESTSIRTVGVAAVGRRSIHVTDPGVADLAPLAAATSRDGGVPRIDVGDPWSGWLLAPEDSRSRWQAGVSELAGAGIPARIVGFDQRVWVAVRGEEVRHDIRRSRRLEAGTRGGDSGILSKVLRDTIPATRDLAEELEVERRRKREAAPIDAAPRGGPVVFAPGAAGIVVHELVGHALEGDLDPQNVRLLRGGDRVGPSGLRVIDDPRLGRAPWRIDDEGVGVRPVTLVEGGRVVGKLHDRTTARQDDSGSTGHGRRGSYLDAVLPRMGCTYIDAGHDDPAAILAGTRRGIYVRALEGGHADPCSGRATFVVTSADVIEQGETKRPLRPFVLALDALDAIRSIDQIGNDLVFDSCIGSCLRNGQPLVVSVGAPTVRLGLISAVI